MKSLRVTLPLVLACVVSACSDSKSPTAPATPPAAATLTKPVADSPGDGAQLDNIRPTLTVVNGTPNQSGTKTYEFQISDNTAFTASANAVSSPEVSEDPSGRTKFTVGQDLQPTTTYYWHARVVQGTSKSDWSDTRSFKTKLVGFNRPGALYDPLVNSETVGSIGGSGNITWVPGEGIRMNDELAYVVYELPQVLSSGEISVEVTGLHPNGPLGKPRIFSILDQLGAIASSSRYSMNAQYRGAGGNPNNCIAWKAIFGDNSQSLEASTAQRFNSVYYLDPSKVYLWQGLWTSNSFRLVVKEGGTAGSVVYDVGVQSATGNWNPAKMFAFLGTNNGAFVEFDGTYAGMTLRNLWVGSTPRPPSLGSAIAQRR